jgi:hypothetical protein
MKKNHPESLGARVGRTRRGWIAALFVAVLLASASPAVADEYDSSTAGHPLRMVAYALHPVGVVIDYLILRPVHWIGSFEPMKTLFGHED